MLNEIVLPTIHEAETEIKIADQVLELINEKTLAYVEGIVSDLEYCESPIEQLMSVALTTDTSAYFRNLKSNFDIFDIERQIEIEYEGSVNTRKIRTDFLIRIADQQKKCEFQFVIECDGYEFHSSKKKFETDRKRDRDLLSGGIVTMRFSGREIVDNPTRCAHTIFKTIYQYVKRHCQF